MKKISLYLLFSLLFSNQVIYSYDGFLEKYLLEKIIDGTIYLVRNAKDVATSDIAIKVYVGIIATAGGLGATTAIEPTLAKYRQATGTENINDMHVKAAKAALQKQQIEIDDTYFQVQMAKIKELSNHFPHYEATKLKKLQAIKESAQPEEEKQKQIAEIEARLQKTRQNLDDGSAESYEKLVDSTSSNFKSFMIHRARNS